MKYIFIFLAILLFRCSNLTVKKPESQNDYFATIKVVSHDDFPQCTISVNEMRAGYVQSGQSNEFELYEGENYVEVEYQTDPHLIEIYVTDYKAIKKGDYMIIYTIDY